MFCTIILSLCPMWILSGNLIHFLSPKHTQYMIISSLCLYIIATIHQCINCVDIDKPWHITEQGIQTSIIIYNWLQMKLKKCPRPVWFRVYYTYIYMAYIFDNRNSISTNSIFWACSSMNTPIYSSDIHIQNWYDNIKRITANPGPLSLLKVLFLRVLHRSCS